MSAWALSRCTVVRVQRGREYGGRMLDKVKPSPGLLAVLKESFKDVEGPCRVRLGCFGKPLAEHAVGVEGGAGRRLGQ